jgi:uncharacterized protein
MAKFQPISFYKPESSRPGEARELLPFRFKRLADGVLLTNMVGEQAIVPPTEFDRFVSDTLDSASPVFTELRSKHFFYFKGEISPIHLLALKLRTRKRRLADFTGLHLFVVTLRCEHSCPYCQVSRANETGSADRFDMKLDTAMKALDLVFRSPSPNLKIEFQGGEPLLNFEVIRSIVIEAEKRNELAKRNLAFVIATNLALINDEILKFCSDHSIFISTSLDGPRDLHNLNRPRPGGDSYERVVAGIQRARTILGESGVSALMTTTQASLGRAREIIDEYRSHGFTEIFLRPLSPYGFAIKTKSFLKYNADRWLEFYNAGLDYVIELNRQGTRFTEIYTAMILKKMLTNDDPGYVDLMTPAGTGIAAVVYNYDGNVFASDEGRMLAEMGSDTFLLGDLKTDSYEEIFTSPALLDSLEESFSGSAPMCTDCAHEPYCGSDPVWHYAMFGNYLGRKTESEFCARHTSIFEGILTRMRSDNFTRNLFHDWAHL